MRLAVMCVGNDLRRDDGVGPALAGILSDRGIIVYDARTAPENFVSSVKKDSPDVLLIVDAADMGLNPGEIRIIPPGHISLEAMSTHTIPLSILVEHLESHCGEILVIGIQPAVVDFGTGLSPEVERAVEKVADLILRRHYRDIKVLDKK